MDLFTSKGGTNLAASVEAFAQSPLGKAFIDKAIKPKQPSPQADSFEADLDESLRT
jgi:hypothetical protein